MGPPTLWHEKHGACSFAFWNILQNISISDDVHEVLVTPGATEHCGLSTTSAGGAEQNPKASDILQASVRRLGPGSDPELVSDLVAMPDLILNAAERVR